MINLSVVIKQLYLGNITDKLDLALDDPVFHLVESNLITGKTRDLPDVDGRNARHIVDSLNELVDLFLVDLIHFDSRSTCLSNDNTVGLFLEAIPYCLVYQILFLRIKLLLRS